MWREVRELMHQQVAHDLRPLEQQAAIETDGAAGRTAAPAGTLVSDLQAREAHAHEHRQRVQLWCKQLVGAAPRRRTSSRYA